MVRTCVVLAVVLVGCGPPNPAQRLAENASDMNTAARFGRMDIAMDFVGDVARQDFAKRHAAWGRDVRILDLELEGMSPAGKEEADVRLSVSWQRVGDPTVLVTQLAQRWRDDRGWRMVAERRTAGDLGLLADGPKLPAAEEHAETARFRTHVIPADE